MSQKFTWVFMAITVGGLSAGAALSDGTHSTGEAMHGGHADMTHSAAFAFGEAGKAANVSRTIEIEMTDNAYNHSALDVKPGETIRFLVHNKGEAVHEFNIATSSMHEEHQSEMMKMMESGALDVDHINHDKMATGAMMHNDPNSVLLEPGTSAELIWQFNEAQNVEFACNIPGHYESGMHGQITFHH